MDLGLKGKEVAWSRWPRRWANISVDLPAKARRWLSARAAAAGAQRDGGANSLKQTGGTVLSIVADCPNRTTLKVNQVALHFATSTLSSLTLCGGPPPGEFMKFTMKLANT